MLDFYILIYMKVSESILKEDLPAEKIVVLKHDGNALITANPGTGKTLLLVYKYITLIENGLSPKDILCLTFTSKAKSELEERIIKEFKNRNLKGDLSDIKVHTFHSYALEYLDQEEVVSSNLLRYAIYEVLKNKEVLNYGDNYLIETIVPKMENLLRYLKSFNVLPKDIDLKKVKSLLKASDKYSKEEIDSFADYFLEIFNHYELIKSNKGIDYSDMLINFLKIKNIPKFKYVLVDELQDVNSLEADISILSADNFVAVGDKKQAIFGFQGGSISNFDKFNDSKKFVLSKNFRSSQPILDYAKDKLATITKDESIKEDLKNLSNDKSKLKDKPIVYLIDKKKIIISACELAKTISENFKENKQVAVIVRNNSQLVKVSKELKARNIEHSSTFFSASQEAKENLIIFLKGLFSKELEFVKKSMFTPFFPITFSKAFELSSEKGLTVQKIEEACPKFKELREAATNLKTVDDMFENYLLPICVSYGKEYTFALMSVKDSFNESFKYLDDINYDNVNNFLLSSDLLSRDIDSKSKIIVTTVHKAKGLEFEEVIYLPKQHRERRNFQDAIVETILKTKGINADEELEEESDRIDFVAFTRAKEKLYIIPEKPEEYITKYCESGKYEPSTESIIETHERFHKAFSLFVSKDYKKAEEYLENEQSWIKTFIKNYFKNLEGVSFTKLNTQPLDFLKNNILNISSSSFEMNLGSKVHNYAESLLKGEKPLEEKEIQAYLDNVKKLITEIKKTYPEPVKELIEKKFTYSLKELFGIESNFKFTGILDAVFTNGKEYLIVDWKTSKKTDSAGEYRQQLSGYKKALSLIKEIPESKIKIAIGFVGLKTTINTGKIEHCLDDSQPRTKAINTLTKHVEKILEWKKDPDTFMDELMQLEEDKDPLWRAVVEQLKKE